MLDTPSKANQVFQAGKYYQTKYNTYRVNPNRGIDMHVIFFFQVLLKSKYLSVQEKKTACPLFTDGFFCGSILFKTAYSCFILNFIFFNKK